MKKLSEKTYRRYIANTVIIFIFAMLISLTYIGQTTSVFSSNSYEPYYCGNKTLKNVSLMFNVYMGTEYIDGILDTLEKGGATATFFVGGSWAIKNDDLVKKIFNSGHEIANHGYWHKDHKKISVEKNREEIYLTHKVVKSITGYDMTLFAPPSGSFGDKTLKVAQDLGYKTILWTKDTIDWRDKDENLIYSRAIKNPQNGDLILMHPTECTLKSLSKIISFYNNQGYKLTTVLENIS